MAPARDIVGRVLGGKFRIVEQIGEGGMGTVYYAEQLPMRRACAVKVLHSSSADFQERFRREGELASRIRDPHVVTIYDYGQDGDVLYLAMEYVDGTTLQRALKAGAMPLTKVIRISRQVAIALTAAHQLRAVHRDLKPANIMLADGSLGELDVRVLDFGLVKTRSSQALTQPGLFMGSPKYVSPEQIQCAEVDGRTDLYSLGVVMWHMLAGREPYNGPSPMDTINMHLADQVPPVPRGDVPPALLTLVYSMMSLHPDGRPGSAREVVMRLDRISEEMDHTTRSGMRSLPARDGDDHTLTVWAAVALAALALALAWALSGCIGESRWESQISQPIGTGGTGPVQSGYSPGTGSGLGGWGSSGTSPPLTSPSPPVIPGSAQCFWPSTAHCNGDLTACEPLNTLRNCGNCGVPCRIPGARVTCRNRYCEFLGCQRHRGDCDFQTFNGCETFLQRDLFNCGACGISCAHLPGATAGRCEDGECVVAACLPGLGDCNEEPQDGCETRLGTQQHCGGCDQRCGDSLTLATCLPHGQCQFLGCSPGAADCQGSGKCIALSTNRDCGACGVRCPPMTTCRSGACQ